MSLEEYGIAVPTAKLNRKVVSATADDERKVQSKMKKNQFKTDW